MSCDWVRDPAVLSTIMALGAIEPGDELELVNCKETHISSVHDTMIAVVLEVKEEAHTYENKATGIFKRHMSIGTAKIVGKDPYTFWFYPVNVGGWRRLLT